MDPLNHKTSLFKRNHRVNHQEYGDMTVDIVRQSGALVCLIDSRHSCDSLMVESVTVPACEVRHVQMALIHSELDDPTLWYAPFRGKLIRISENKVSDEEVFLAREPAGFYNIIYKKHADVLCADELAEFVLLHPELLRFERGRLTRMTI